uniref:F-box domain-containing protein n=1 Tax=Strongyloides papillosus TaxID=174720 RepID=A0A0N5C1P3_STREA
MSDVEFSNDDSSNRISENPFLLLPHSLVKATFNRLYWTDIRNLKKVSRFFNNFITQNNTLLPRPRLSDLKITSNSTKKYTYLKATFIMMDNNKKFGLSERVPNECTNYNSLRINSILERFDLTNIQSIRIKSKGREVIFQVMNNHFKDETTVNFLELTIVRCPNFDVFSAFMGKMKYVTNLVITRICFTNETEVPNNYILPFVRNMTSISVAECNCRIHFINPQMIDNLFISNPRLQLISFHSKLKDFDIKVVECIKDRQLYCSIDSSEDGECQQHKNFLIILPFKVGIDITDEFIRFFGDGPYYISEYSLNTDNLCYFSVQYHCEVCMRLKIIRLLYTVPEIWNEHCDAR